MRERVLVPHLLGGGSHHSLELVHRLLTRFRFGLRKVSDGRSEHVHAPLQRVSNDKVLLSVWSRHLSILSQIKDEENAHVLLPDTRRSQKEAE